MTKKDLMFWLAINAFGAGAGYVLMVRNNDWGMFLLIAAVVGLIVLVEKLLSL